MNLIELPPIPCHGTQPNFWNKRSQHVALSLISVFDTICDSQVPPGWLDHNSHHHEGNLDVKVDKSALHRKANKHTNTESKKLVVLV